MNSNVILKGHYAEKLAGANIISEHSPAHLLPKTVNK